MKAAGGHFSESRGEGEGLNLYPVFCCVTVWSQPSSVSKHGGEVILQPLRMCDLFANMAISHS